MQIIKGKNRLDLVPSLTDVRAKHLTQGIPTEVGKGKACGSEVIDNIDGKSLRALSYIKVTVRAHFTMLDKAFTRSLLNNMLSKKQENNALGINAMAH